MVRMMTKYDLHIPCIICGNMCDYLNGKTNSNIVYIKNKRRSVVLVHKSCIDKERKDNEEKRDKERDN